MLTANTSKEEVIGYLNDNTHKLMAWKTDNATIATRGKGGIPIHVRAEIAVESPRKFRLIAYSPVGREVDLGSNPEKFWFWSKHNEEKHVFTASHDKEIGSSYRVPFQPDWIIESLGVIDIDPEKTTMLPGDPGSNTVYLMADRVSPQRQKIRKRTVVDLCRGVVREHSLFDARGQMIARAVLSNHSLDTTSQAMLPKRIALDWPQAELHMTMDLSDIEVNPAYIPEELWKVPKITGYPVFDLTP